MAGGDKHLFRCAASVWTGAAQVPIFDEADIRIGGDELGPERRITEDKQNGWTKLYSSLCGEVRLINFAEKLNAFFGDRPLNAFGGLLDRYPASHPDDAVVLGGGRPHR